MANNEKVSQLVELFASDFQSNDVFLITDTSQKESKKVELGQLLLFIESSGSFQSYHSVLADTASYISVNNINGIIPFSTNSSQSISSSWASSSISSSYSGTSSYASTASFILGASSITIVPTASFLQYQGFPNGTASYALQSSLASDASTAYNLFYNGVTPNGTASYAMFSSASISSSYATTSSYSTTSSYVVTSSYSTNSSSSIIAQTASFVSIGGLGPTFIIPISIFNENVNYNTQIIKKQFSCIPYVPSGTKAVILDAQVSIPTGATTEQYTVTINISNVAGGTPYYVLSSCTATGNASISNLVTSGTQGSFPINVLGNLWYSITANAVSPNASVTIRLIGYY